MAWKKLNIHMCSPHLLLPLNILPLNMLLVSHPISNAVSSERLDEVPSHVMSHCDVGMTSSHDVTHHVTSLVTWLVVIAFNRQTVKGAECLKMSCTPIVWMRTECPH